MSLIEIKAVFHGKVQKVGFRWTVLERAEQFQLLGTVRNLPNGNVEVHVVGNRPACEKFIESLQKDSGFAKIEKTEIIILNSQDKYIGFKII